MVGRAPEMEKRSARANKGGGYSHAGHSDHDTPEPIVIFQRWYARQLPGWATVLQTGIRGKLQILYPCGNAQEPLQNAKYG